MQNERGGYCYPEGQVSEFRVSRSDLWPWNCRWELRRAVLELSSALDCQLPLRSVLESEGIFLELNC